MFHIFRENNFLCKLCWDKETNFEGLGLGKAVNPLRKQKHWDFWSNVGVFGKGNGTLSSANTVFVISLSSSWKCVWTPCVWLSWLIHLSINTHQLWKFLKQNNAIVKNKLRTLIVKHVSIDDRIFHCRLTVELSPVGYVCVGMCVWGCYLGRCTCGRCPCVCIRALQNHKYSVSGAVSFHCLELTS